MDFVSLGLHGLINPNMATDLRGNTVVWCKYGENQRSRMSGYDINSLFPKTWHSKNQHV